MISMKFFIVLLLISQSAFGIVAADKEVPFWKSKPEVARRIREERTVVVSSRRETVTAGGREEIRFTIKGAGHVKAPRDFSFEEAQRYDKLKSISDHFQKVGFDAKTKRLHLVMEALGYVADMVLLIEPVRASDRDDLQWQVISGHFKGMRGTLGFETVGAGKTEASIDAVYQAETLPLPRILMGIALEAIFQKVAEKMRAAIESAYQARSI